MTLQAEYNRLCQAIDGLQWQMFKQGKKHNEFMQRDLMRLQKELRQLYLLTSGKILEEKTRSVGQRPERRDDL